MNARKLALAILTSVCPLAAAGLLATPAMAQGECSNEQLRTGYSSYLSDCRAYELVSLPSVEPYFEELGTLRNETGTGLRELGQPATIMGSVSGNRVLYMSLYGLPGSHTDGSYFFATRGADGWTNENPIPPQSVSNNDVTCPNTFIPLLTPEFTNWVQADGDGYGEVTEAEEEVEEHNCGIDEPELVSGEPREHQNLFLHNLGGGFEAGDYQLIDTPQDAPANPSLVDGSPVWDAWAQGASEDLSRIVFTESSQLTPEAPPITRVEGTKKYTEDLYVWSEGVVRLVTVLPGGKAVSGTLPTGAVIRQGHEVVGLAPLTHAVSSDGQRVAFAAEGNLYVRENPAQPREAECATPESVCTVQLDASQGGSESGGGQFEWASGNGAHVFFRDEKKLTKDATATAGKPDLYEYDLEAPEGQRLADLTVNAGEPADVLGVSGASEDGSYLYFFAEGVLTGEQQNSHGDRAQAGKPNLYLRHAGATTFIATLDQGDADDWPSPPSDNLTAQVAPNGRFIAFDSLAELTGYDNKVPCAGGGSTTEPVCQEVFLYEAESGAHGTLSCASCNPSGEPPRSPASIMEPKDNSGTINEETLGHMPRNVSDNGQVFFNSAESLVPLASNGSVNVYEYEHGQIHLISTGTAAAGSYLVEASADGSNVFFLTGQELTPAYTESIERAPHSSMSIYDARIDGGFPEPGSPTVCSEEDCRGALTPTPLLGAPSSQTFAGAGNPVAPSTAPKATTKHVKSNPKKKKKHKTKGKKRKGKNGKGKKALRAKRSVRRDRGGVR